MIKKIIFLSVLLALPVLGQNNRFFQKKSDKVLFIVQKIDSISKEDPAIPDSAAFRASLNGIASYLETDLSLNRLGSKIIFERSEVPVFFNKAEKTARIDKSKPKIILPARKKINWSFYLALTVIGLLAILFGFVATEGKGFHAFPYLLVTSCVLGFVGYLLVLDNFTSSEFFKPNSINIILFQTAYAFVLSGATFIAFMKSWLPRRRKKK
jgi:hypothetical protein